MKSSFNGRVSTKGCSQECVLTLMNKAWEIDAIACGRLASERGPKLSDGCGTSGGSRWLEGHVGPCATWTCPAHETV